MKLCCLWENKWNWKLYVKWNKPVTERQILHVFFLMHNLDLKEIPWIYKEDLLVGRIKWERGEKGEGGRGLNMVKVTYMRI
jgi:hypothetical protein